MPLQIQWLHVGRSRAHLVIFTVQQWLTDTCENFQMSTFKWWDQTAVTWLQRVTVSTNPRSLKPSDQSDICTSALAEGRLFLLNQWIQTQVWHKIRQMRVAEEDRLLVTLRWHCDWLLWNHTPDGIFRLVNISRSVTVLCRRSYSSCLF